MSGDEFGELKLRLTGIVPLLMKNPAYLADPRDPRNKALKALRKKASKMTDADYEEAAGIEFALSLYYDDDIGPYIPGANIIAMLAENGGFYRLGKPIRRATITVGDGREPLIYDGPRDIPGMLNAGFAFTRPVFLNTNGKRSSVLTTHPRFQNWALECIIRVDNEEVPREGLEPVLRRVGKMGAIGDFRPRYGRFNLEWEWA